MLFEEWEVERGPQISNAPSVAVVLQFVEPFSKLPFCNVPTVPQESVLTTELLGNTNKNGITTKIVSSSQFLYLYKY